MIPFLLTNKYAQYGLVTIIVIGMLLGVRQHYINIGKNEGQVGQKRTETAQDEKDRVDSQKSLTDALDRANLAIKAASQRESQAQIALNTTLATLRAISSQKQAGTEKVNSLSDSQAHAYNLGLLGGSQGEACYSGQQERQIAESLTQYPLCKKEVSADQESIKAINDRISALNDKIAEKDKEFAVMTNAKHESDVRYVRLYNRYPPTYRSPKCLWLTKCGKRNLDLPIPEQGNSQ